LGYHVIDYLLGAFQFVNHTGHLPRWNPGEIIGHFLSSDTFLEVTHQDNLVRPFLEYRSAIRFPGLNEFISYIKKLITDTNNTLTTNNIVNRN